MSNALVTLTNKLAEAFDMGNGADLIATLKATAFRGEVSDAQMTALLIVANQYRLNPWTKEIYAFPDKKSGIVPVVGVDGWARIINSHQQFDGMEFTYSDELVQMPSASSKAPEWIECRMYRKDRSRPVAVREYLDECYREPFKGQYGVQNGPWQTHPKRFLRHKSTIQCARLAFGFVGIYDQDEAERIIEQPEKDITPRAGTIASNSPRQVADPDEALLLRVNEAANLGGKALDAIWADLTIQERQSLRPFVDSFKSRATTADQEAEAKRTVNVSPDGVIDDEFVRGMQAAEEV